MITCPFCATTLNLNEVKNAYCDFCEIELGSNSIYGMYSVDGVRQEKVKNMNFVTSETAKLPISQLKELNPLDLILCLKAARSERAEIFSVMRLFNKAGDSEQIIQEQVVEYQAMADDSGKDYEYWTRKCWTIENLLIERIGYFPERINQEFLSSFITKKEKSLSKAMTISKQKVVYKN